MSTRLDINKASLALLKLALPGADVRGLDNATTFPERIPPNGLAILRDGDLVLDDTTLSPLTYHYQLRSSVEIAAYSSATATNSEALDAMVTPVGAAIVANRTLGGLCDWLDAEPAPTDDIAQAGAMPAKGTIIMLVASFSTENPLS